jgi:hypothetical protein
MKRDKSDSTEAGVDGAGTKLPTVEECRRLKSSLRAHLERVDDEVRHILNRVEAQRPRSDEELRQLHLAAATVAATVAAGILEIVAERTREPFGPQAFAEAARDAAYWAQARGRRAQGKKK